MINIRLIYILLVPCEGNGKKKFSLTSTGVFSFGQVFHVRKYNTGVSQATHPKLIVFLSTLLFRVPVTSTVQPQSLVNKNNPLIFGLSHNNSHKNMHTAETSCKVRRKFCVDLNYDTRSPLSHSHFN